MKKQFLKSAYIIYFSLSSIITLTNCESEKDVEKVTFLQKIVLNAEDSLDGTIRKKGDAHGGEYYSHTDSIYRYGMGMVFKIDDSLREKDIRVCIDLWARTNKLNSNQSIAVALHDDENLIQWAAFYLDKKMNDANKWIHIKDSLVISGSLINRSGLEIRIFPYNSPSNSFLDTDDIEITLKKIETKSI
jgi:hypothetical protein